MAFPLLLLLLSTLLASISETNAWVTSSQPYFGRSITTQRFSSSETAETPPKAAVPTSKYSLDGNEIRGPLTPMGNSILIRIKDTLTATTGGILLPDQSKERPTEGVVLEAGPGKLHPFTGVRITNPIKKEMSVVYGKYDGRPVEYNGEECQVIRDDDVMLYYYGVQMKIETVEPVRDYVLVELDPKFGREGLETASGVVIAGQVMKDSVPCEGKVFKVGEGRLASLGELTKSPVKPGDMVKFKDYAGNDIMIEGKPFSVVKMVDILCTFQPEAEEEKSEAL